MYKKLVIVLTFVVLAKTNPSQDIYENCGGSIKCVEQNLIQLVDECDSKSSVSLLGDYLVLEKTNEETFIPKSEEGIFERILRFLTNHELRLRFPSRSNARSIIEESRKSKLRRLILPILLLLKLKALIVIPAILFVIALVAFKGMGAGVMALFISSGIALKSLLQKSSSSTFSYEILPQIQSPHWSRNGVQTVDGWTGLVPGYQTIAH